MLDLALDEHMRERSQCEVVVGAGVDVDARVINVSGTIPVRDGIVPKRRGS